MAATQSMHRSILVGTVLLLAAAGTGHACPPAVILAGDDALVEATRRVLDDRGVELEPGAEPGCAIVRARVVQRDGTIVVSLGARRDAIADRERVVHDVATAATVIESFVRADLTAPLLARRRLSAPAASHAPPTVAAVERIPTAPTRSVHLFAGIETSIGSDRTHWLGGQVGACVMLGPICAAARLRYAAVVAGPGPWGFELERSGAELLLGIDVPFAIGRTTVSPGFAAGLGKMFTSSDDRQIVGHTGGLRADVHATVAIPVGEHLSIELSTALDLTQETHVESEMELPDEPLALLRFGVGVRYGGL